MDGWQSKAVIIGLLVIIVGIPVLYRPAAAVVEDDAAQIVILTPHNEQIRYETGEAFRRWHREKFGQDVDMQWRSVGGTSDIERLLFSQYRVLAEEDRLDEGSGYDMVFGGGTYFFSKLARGIDGVPLLQPAELDPQLIEEVYPGRTLAGSKLYDAEQGLWYAVVLSSFGIVYNNDLLYHLNSEPPTGWKDLADPKYFGWIALADPSHSGSVRATYNAVVQWYGWERGWKTLRRACANSRYFAHGSSRVPVDVSQGEAVMGVCIDFYGRFQSQMVGEAEVEAVGDKPRIEYIAPEAGTAYDGDPIAILQGAPNKVIARRFIEFLLSYEGQAVWGFYSDDDDATPGPRRYELRRPPVRAEMYEPENYGRLVDQVNYYQIAQALPEGTANYFSIIPIVMHSMAMDIHDDLKAAWKAIIETRAALEAAEDDTVKAALQDKLDRMLELFDAMPFTEEKLMALEDEDYGGQKQENDYRIHWTGWFRDNYHQILEIAAE